jgi:preprotein translocase subunit SecA
MAGEKGAVTVATNMAGRGTDIKLGGNFEYRLNKALEEAGLALGDMEKLQEIDAIRARVREQCDADERVVLELGGLYVLGTERHEARRIDNQLRGRSGRQGNAGRSRFYLSLEDDLMRIFYRDWVKNAMEKLGMSEDVPIESGMVTRAIAKAQKKVEDRNFEIRKSLLEYDEVMNQQRKEIYGTRQDVLENFELREKIVSMFGRTIERHARHVFLLDPKGFAGWFQRTFGFEISETQAADATAKAQGITRPVLDLVLAQYAEREQAMTPEMMRQVERYLLLKALDDKWRDHLHAIDALKAGIGLRGYGQVDPKNEYKREGFQLFEQLLQAIEDEVASLILRIQVNREAAPRMAGQPAPRFVNPAGPTLGGRPSSIVAALAAEGGAPATSPAAAPTSAAAMMATPAAGAPRAPGQGQAGQGQPAAQPGPAQPAPGQARPAAAGPAQPARRMPMPTHVPASHAFDAARRAQAIAAAREAQARPAASGPGGASTARTTARPLTPKELEGVGRNDLCPCGSGQKFKKCHGKEA